MKRFAFALLFAALIGMGCKAMGEELDHRPNDAEVVYLTVVGTPGEARFESLKLEFETHDGLKGLTEETHFTVLADTSTLFRTRYSGEFGRLPVVRLQEADGDVIYEASGRLIPDADQLYTELNRKVTNDPTCYRRQRQGEQEMIDVTPVKKEKTPPPVEKRTPRYRWDWMFIAQCCGVALVGFLLGIGRVVKAEWSSL